MSGDLTWGGLTRRTGIAMERVVWSAFDDIRRGFTMRRVWMALAQEDIGDQHRRTTLGPLWLLINYLLLTGAFVVIFGHQTAIPDFAAYVGTGLFVWLYISEVITQGISLFTREQSFIQGHDACRSRSTSCG